MSNSCDFLEKKKVLVGNNVSHSNRKTKRVYKPNLLQTVLKSEILGQDFKVKIACKTLRTIDKKGGLDPFLLGTYDKDLTCYAIDIKKKIKKKSQLSKSS